MITRLLVANRGEIARRVQAACRARGISTAAVFSDPDAGAPFVVEADVAVRLPGAAPANTYLNIDAVVAAARSCGADAVHPGYGFLSENSAFARAVLAAGLTWVGPTPESIEAMGAKVAAKKLVAAAGVPVLAELDPAVVTAADLPLLVKASAGGGGRGMREVHQLADLADAVAAAEREALSAFGDGTVFCEPLLRGARHVEVQLMADTHGTVWTLTERDCSLQRRHQKVVEESPSPGVDVATRVRLHAAARAAAGALGYVGAGTVEMLLADDGRLAFLEVNTRLQVEHPVTEAVHRVDLVGWQIAVAEGAALPPEPPPAQGHAVEVRLYAEDPGQDWRPASGRLHRLHVPGVDAEFAVPAGVHGLRLDSGVVDGDEIGVHYDPMLAKLVAHGPDRASALRRLVTALRGAQIHGLTTNRELLLGLLTHPEVAGDGVDTGWLDAHDPAALSVAPARVDLAALAAALVLAEKAWSRHPLSTPTGWRNLPSAPTRTTFTHCDTEMVVEHLLVRGCLLTPPGVDLAHVDPEGAVLVVDGVQHRFSVAVHGDAVSVDSALGAVSLTWHDPLPEPQAVLAPGALVAPMPGSVVRLSVTEGQTVAAGAEVLVMEAMKMEHRVLAPTAGTVTTLAVAQGDQVAAGTVLAVVQAQEEDQQ
ncbi:MAG: biotin carboxylase N-terminal domain-containing protein [Mycobacteriaceae bacterium]